MAAAVWWCERAARTTCRLPSLSHTLMHKCLNTNTSSPLGTPFYPSVQTQLQQHMQALLHMCLYILSYLQSKSLSVTPFTVVYVGGKKAKSPEGRWSGWERVTGVRSGQVRAAHGTLLNITHAFRLAPFPPHQYYTFYAVDVNISLNVLLMK